MNDVKKMHGQEKQYLSQYSEQYKAIRQEAESRWPQLKVNTYNTSIAISLHARKLNRA